METNLRKIISIVIPCYNEEDNVLPIYNEICRVWKAQVSEYDLEMIFIDDHSCDSTFSVLQDLLKADKRLKIIRLSKNFGHQKAIFAGVIHSSGEAVIQLDCDLQDPPSMIPEMIRFWEEGNHIVYGIRRSRDESLPMQYLRKTAYVVINWLSEAHLPVNAGDFRLIDSKIIEILKKLDDDQSYLRGTIASLGFRQHGIEYDRNARHKGRSKYSLWKLFKLGVNGILNHSAVPLRLATCFGLLISVITLILLVLYALFWYLGIGNWPEGFATTTLLIIFSIGLNSIFLGIIGEYLARIYRVLKKNSLIHVQNKVGF